MGNKDERGEKIFYKGEKILEVLFCSVLFLNELLSVLNDTMPKKTHVPFFRKMPRLRAITTGLLRHLKWEKNTYLKNICNISLEKSRVVRGKGKGRGCKGKNMSADVAKKGQIHKKMRSGFPNMACSVLFERHALCDPSSTLKVSLSSYNNILSSLQTSSEL